MNEYHQHNDGSVVQGPASRCIDPGAGAIDVRVVPMLPCECGHPIDRHLIDGLCRLCACERDPRRGVL